jgi:flagellin-like protein
MWIMGRHFNNRAVSAVIATLLLIAIAVAAAIIVYVFSIGLLGGLQTSGGQQVKQQVILEAYDWTGATLKLTLRNVGPASVQFQDYFISGSLITTVTGTCGYSGATTSLKVGQSCTATLTPTSSVSAVVAYVLKVVSVDGAVFSYSAIDGSAN